MIMLYFSIRPSHASSLSVVITPSSPYRLHMAVCRQRYELVVCINTLSWTPLKWCCPPRDLLRMVSSSTGYPGCILCPKFVSIDGMDSDRKIAWRPSVYVPHDLDLQIEDGLFSLNFLGRDFFIADMPAICMCQICSGLDSAYSGLEIG